MLWTGSKKTAQINNNRIHFVMAIVFLFGAVLIVKLYYLQVVKHKEYFDIAFAQHVATKVLDPQRGNIYLQDSEKDTEEKYFPIATNKDFALLYAVPSEAEKQDLAAKALYHIFDKNIIKKEVDELIDKQLKEKHATTAPIILTDEEKEEVEKQRVEEVDKRRQAKIEEYYKKITKENDPYEPLAQKVNDENLLKFYSALEMDPALFESNEDKRDKEIKFDIASFTVFDGKVYKTGESEEKIEVKHKGYSFTMKTYRYYPENNIGSHILGFVQYSDESARGKYGLEEFFDEELTGLPGKVVAERGAKGDLIIINDRKYTKPINGHDLVLTIERAIQFTACEKLNKAVMRHGADSGSVIVLDPATGAILAMCSYPDFDPNNYREVTKISDFNNLAIFDQYEPGSIFKAITMSVALDVGKVSPETTYTDTGSVRIAGYNIENSDHKANGVQTMTQVLEKSLNTGVIYATKLAGVDNFQKYIANYGFGEKTGIELGGEALGDIRNLNVKQNRELYTYTASFGQGISVTPLQMAVAFSAIANGGVIMKPYVVKEIKDENGQKSITNPRETRRIVSQRTASLLSGMLVNVIENGHGAKAGVKGYWIAGKTGTAQVPRKDGKGYQSGAHIGSFAGFGPVEKPVFAMIVRIDNPRDVQWAESSAAPLFGEIAEFILNYKKVPTARDTEVKKK